MSEARFMAYHMLPYPFCPFIDRLLKYDTAVVSMVNIQYILHMIS